VKEIESLRATEKQAGGIEANKGEGYAKTGSI